MKYFYLVLFVFASILHLYASFTKNKKLRAISKPVLLPSLLFFYLHSISNPSAFVILAIVFSWLGDVFLIPKGLKWFTAGGISFMISHTFFILAYTENVNVFNLRPIIYVIFALLYAVIVFIAFLKLRLSLKKQIRIPIAAYLLINGAMNCFAIFRLFSTFYLGSIIAVIGAVCFFVSDVILFFVRFDKNCKIQSHFWVMIFYLLGEALIIFGFVL